MAKTTKQHRRPEEIASEYGRVCAELGEAVYRRDIALPAAIDELMERAKRLNLEAHEAQRALTRENPSNGNP